MLSTSTTTADAVAAPSRRMPSLSLRALAGAARSVAWFVGPLAVGVLLWDIGARISDTPAVPTVGEIWSAFVLLLERGEILDSLALSLAHALAALALAIVVGIAVGVAMGRSEIAEAAARPYVDLLMSAPLAVLVPVFAAVFSGQSQVIIATAFMYCVFPIIENTRMGVRAAAPELLAMTRSFGIPRRRVVTGVLVPASLPLMLTGVAIAVSKAFKGVLLGEILITVVGLGGRLHYYGAGFQTDKVYALTVTTIAVSLALVAIMAVVERWLRRRYPSGVKGSVLES